MIIFVDITGIDMDFKESAYGALVEEIFTLFPSVQRDGFKTGAYKPGLEAMEAFCEALGHLSPRRISVISGSASASTGR